MINHIEKLETLIPRGDGYNSEYTNTLLDAIAYIRRLEEDKARIDWLADPEQFTGRIQLPTKCVEDTCPGYIPTACSNECGEIMMPKIGNSEWILQGVYLSDIDGDPGRTLRRINAKQFELYSDARTELIHARRLRPFITGEVQNW